MNHPTTKTDSPAEKKVLFAERFGLSAYKIMTRHEDEETLLEWKKKVDEIRTYVQKRIEENFSSPENPPVINGKPYILSDKRIMRALGSEAYDDDITLFSIGAFVLAHYPQFSRRRAGMKIATGGEFKLADYGKGVTTCIDAAAAVEHLAAMYGISGSIKRHGTTYGHYWQETGGAQRVIDITGLNNLNGFALEAKPKPQEVGVLQKLARSSLLKWALAAGVIFGGTKVYHDQVTQPALEERIVERNSPAKLAGSLTSITDRLQSDAREVSKEGVVAKESRDERRYTIQSDVVKIEANIFGDNTELEVVQGKKTDMGGEHVFNFISPMSNVGIGKGANAIMINRSFDPDTVARKIKEGDKIWYLTMTLITFDRDENQKPYHFRITQLVEAGDNTKLIRPMETIAIHDAGQSEAMKKAVTGLYDEVKKYQDRMGGYEKRTEDTAKKAQELVKDTEFVKKLQSGSIQIVFSDGAKCTGFKYDESTIITARHCTLDGKKRVGHLNILLPTGDATVKRKLKAVPIKEGEYAIELATENNEDVAVITFAKPLFKKENLLPISKDPLVLGETYILGHFRGYGKKEKWKMDAGKMSDYSDATKFVGYVREPEGERNPWTGVRKYYDSPVYSSEPGEARVFIDIGVQSGNSGGPVVNTKGEVIGVVARHDYVSTGDGKYKLEDRFRTPRLDAAKIAALVAKAKANLKIVPGKKK